MCSDSSNTGSVSEANAWVIEMKNIKKEKMKENKNSNYT